MNVKMIGQRRALLPALLLGLLVLSACGGQSGAATVVSTATGAVPTATTVPTNSPALPPPPATATPEPPSSTAAPEQTPARPDAADAEIAFVYNGDLAVIAADGSGLRLLTESGDVSQPRWSPDGTRIAFVRGRGSAARIYIAASAGQVSELPHDQGFGQADPRWSPDGQTIAFVRAADLNGDGGLDEQDEPEIWLVDAAGANPRLLADGLDPAWAPDGRRIAFATNGPGENTIDMINNEGQNRWSPIKIARIPQDTSVMNPDAQFNAGTTFVRYPEWAPNNRAIVFNAFGHSGLIVTATDKGEQITPRDFSYEGGFRRVHWSPNGQLLLYEVLPPSGINQVVVQGLDGARHVVFGDPHEGVSAAGPAWSPDSRRVVFVQNSSMAETPTGALVVAAVGGLGEMVTIVESGAAAPDWR